VGEWGGGGGSLCGGWAYDKHVYAQGIEIGIGIVVGEGTEPPFGKYEQGPAVAPFFLILFLIFNF
jgi:hypothetical protein